MASSGMKQAEALSLSEDLTCAICCDLFRDPVMLGCMHHFCKQCITTYWRGIRGPAVCPQCRKEFPRKQFHTNYLVAGLVEKVRASSSSGSVRNFQVRSIFFLSVKRLNHQGLVSSLSFYCFFFLNKSPTVLYDFGMLCVTDFHVFPRSGLMTTWTHRNNN